MKMKRILVIGPSGAGKSTFARKLRDITNLPLTYIDMLFHNADKTTKTEEDFIALLSEKLKDDEWIIEGDYTNSLEMRLARCDTVFMLDFPIDFCLQSAKNRVGEKREDMPWTEEVFDEEFGEWIKKYPSERLPKVNALLEKFSDRVKIFRFKTRGEADIFLENLKRETFFI